MSAPEQAKAQEEDPRPKELIFSCPFCRETTKTKVFRAKDGEKSLSWVYCGGCYATGPMAETDQLAIRRWNARRG